MACSCCCRSCGVDNKPDVSMSMCDEKDGGEDCCAAGAAINAELALGSVERGGACTAASCGGMGVGVGEGE